MDKIPFVDGTKTQEAYVTVNEQNYQVNPAVWTGTVPLSAQNLNKMQDNIDNAKAEKSELNNLVSEVDSLTLQVEDKADQSDLDEITSNMTNQLLNIKSDITDLQTKEVLLFEGNATAGQTITLNDDFTKYRFLYIVNGNSSQDWNGVMIGSTINSSNEMYFTKGFVNSSKNSQIHIATLKKISNTQLQVVECGYKTLSSSSEFTSASVKKIYGSL